MYVYEPLPAGHFIRLIELHPGNLESPIVVTCKIFKLEEVPDYDALSYVWGNPANKGLITCNGQPFIITATLLLVFSSGLMVSVLTNAASQSAAIKLN